MQFQCLDDCPPPFALYLAYCLVAGAVGFLIARRYPWTLLVVLPLVGIGKLLMFGEWWGTTRDTVALAIAVLLPLLGAVSRLWSRPRARDALEQACRLASGSGLTSACSGGLRGLTVRSAG